MTQKEGVFLSIAQNDVNSVLSSLVKAMESKDKHCLKDLYELFNNKDSNLYWDSIKAHSLPDIERYCYDQTTCGDDHLTKNNVDDPKNLLVVIKAIANGIYDFCQVSKFKPSSLLDIIIVIQSLLLVTNSNTISTSSSELMMQVKILIAKVSEYFWINEEEGSEHLMPNLLTHLLITSLDMHHGRDSDIKRVYSLRAAFLLLDFEDKSIVYLISLIHRCFVHPGYLKLSEGRRLLAFLLQSNGGMY